MILSRNVLVGRTIYKAWTEISESHEHYEELELFLTAKVVKSEKTSTQKTLKVETKAENVSKKADAKTDKKNVKVDAKTDVADTIID